MRPEKSPKYLSPQIQNELISLFAQKVNHSILVEIQNAKWLSLIADTTTDLSHVNQLSLVLRYVTVNDNDDNQNFIIQESFMGFSELCNHTSTGLFNPI